MPTLLAFLAPVSTPRPAQWTYGWTDRPGFLLQGLGRAPRKGPVPWASPHTPTGLLAGHPWPPASSPACLWVTPGARPDAVARPRGPSAFSAFVSDDGGSAGGRCGVAQNPAQDVRHPGVGAGSGRGMLTPCFQEGEAMRRGPTGDAQDGGTFSGSGSRVAQRPGSRTGVRGGTGQCQPSGAHGGSRGLCLPEGLQEAPSHWRDEVGEALTSVGSDPAAGHPGRRPGPTSLPAHSPRQHPTPPPPRRRVKSDSNCALFISSAPRSTGCSQRARPGLPPRSAYI